MIRRLLLSRKRSAPPKIFRPDESTEVPKGWLLHAHKARDSHDREARLCVNWHYWLGALVVASSVIAGGLSAGGKAAWLVPVISLVASVLAGWQTFLNFGDRAEKHRTAGTKYKAMIRKMEQLSVRGTAPEDDELTKLCGQLNALEAEAPVIPLRTYDKVQDDYLDAEFVTTVDALLRHERASNGGSSENGGGK